MTLIEHLIFQLQLSRQQAEGGVGLLFWQAQKKLSPGDFLLVADAIPAVSDLIGKAPRQAGRSVGSMRAVWLRWFSGWGSLASLRPDCESLGLDRAAINQLTTEIGGYFHQRGKTELVSLLHSAWH